VTEAYATAYPLQWPHGRPRTAIGRREYSRFKTTFAKSRDALLLELFRLGARQNILSTNIELRLDGIPYANRRTPDDPGVAVYFEYKGQRMCFACDKYRKIEDNIHAITLTIGALRGIKRWGTGDMMERAFTGFTALPNQSAEHWRDILGVTGIDNLDEIREKYVRLRGLHHPDKGGDSAMFDKIQKAWEQAQQELNA